MCYGSQSISFTGGGIGNNGGQVYAVNTLFAHNYHITGGTVTSPSSFELDDINAYSYQEGVYLYYCIYHATLPSGTNNIIGNLQYTGLQDGSNNSLFSGGSLSKITDGTGTEIGTASIFRPFLYNNSGSVAPTIKIGSFLLQNANKGTQTRFSNNNNVLPALAYYNKTTSLWVDLKNTSLSGQLITFDQINAARANPPVVGAIETATTENLYMVKVNSDPNGTVNGGTFFGDVYPAGTSTTITAIPNSNYHFVRWDYVGGVGGTGTASTANPYTFTVNNNITLLPVFAVNGSSYYITYIGNENTSGEAPATDSYTASTTILPTGTLERVGYSIEGWNTNANGSGTDYIPGATYSAGVNLTLYAKWTKTTAIAANSANDIRLTTATLGGNITPPEAVVLDRGICWKTSSGVTISNNKTSEGGTSSGSFSVAVSNLNPSSTIYYRAYFTTSSGTTLSEEASFSNIPIFTGTGYWDDTERWNVQEVPGNSDETGLADCPVINGICTMANSNPSYWVCKNMTINAGAKLIIQPSQQLSVTGLFTNNADAAGLVIQSDPVLPNATFKFSSGSTRATVEMYSKASWDLSQPSGSKYSWQFFGIPVKTLSYSSTFSSCFVRKFDETSIDDAGLWDMQSSGSVLTSGTGYELVQQKAKKYQFVGELTNEDFVRTLDYTTNGVFAGQHIFGNPYTAAINISQIEFGANTEQAVYLYNTGTYNQWSNPGNISYKDSTTVAGQYTVSTPNTIGELGIPAQIPSMQGFLVKAMNEQGGSINISYQNSTLKNNDSQRVNWNNTLSQYDKVVSKIELTGSHYADCLWVFTNSDCSRKFDNGWDGYKILGSSSYSQIYASEADGNYQIDAVNDINETYLSFQAGQDSVFKLTFTNKNLETRYAGIYLVDLDTYEMVDVSASGSEYHFKAQHTDGPVVRFKIITKTTGINAPENDDVLNVFSAKNEVLIENSSNLNGVFKLYNMSGILVKSGVVETIGITSIPTTGLSAGNYIVKATTANEKVTKRIIIQ